MTDTEDEGDKANHDIRCGATMIEVFGDRPRDRNLRLMLAPAEEFAREALRRARRSRDAAELQCDYLLQQLQGCKRMQSECDGHYPTLGT